MSGGTNQGRHGRASARSSSQPCFSNLPYLPIHSPPLPPEEEYQEVISALDAERRASWRGSGKCPPTELNGAQLRRLVMALRGGHSMKVACCNRCSLLIAKRLLQIMPEKLRP